MSPPPVSSPVSPAVSSSVPPSVPRPATARAIGEQQQRHQREALRSAVRALLMTPLMSTAHEDFPLVRRHAGPLRDWFRREAGWLLTVDRDVARLYKRPGAHDDASRGLPDFDRRRYGLLCLTCAVLERADAQITLRVLGENLLRQAADPALVAAGFSFTLTTQTERRDLVAVCHRLLDFGVLQRVAGSEEGYANDPAARGDALYDVQRRSLAGLLAAVRGPSTWPAESTPATLDEQLRSLVDEYVADGDEARRTALRHRLSRRLLDDPVLYLDGLDEAERAYFVNQRGPLASRLCEATGLEAEQRAEGLALVDEAGELTDVAMPAEGTDAHVTLLAAEFLAERIRGLSAADRDTVLVREVDVADHLRNARERFGRYWRRSAREAGSERELTTIALGNLQRLMLIERGEQGVRPRPALARFALGEARVPGSGRGRKPASEPPDDAGPTGSLF